MKPTAVLVLLFVFYCSARAQNTEGLWKGMMINDSTKKEYPYEIAIVPKKKKWDAFAYIKFTEQDTAYWSVKKLKTDRADDGAIILTDDGMLVGNYTASSVRQTNTLYYSERGDTAFLSGTWATSNTKRFIPQKGTMVLYKLKKTNASVILPHLEEKKIVSADYRNNYDNPAPPVAIVAPPPPEAKEKPVVAATPPKPPTPNPKPKRQPATPPVVKTEPTPSPKPPTAPPPAAEKRKIITIQTLAISSDSITLDLYDNGEVDGDTVSVLLNGQVILAKQGLKTTAIHHTIFPAQHLRGDSMELVMYAENLGSIPPNTGLLVVRDGENMYEIRFSADMQKNAAVIFRRKR